MNLSKEEVAAVSLAIRINRLRISSLRDDVLDHVCCNIEAKLDGGKSFDESLEEAIFELAPDGLEKLENETIALLNSENIAMKKLTYIVGLITTIATTMGFMFKLNHLPAADELFSYGFISFTLLFLPLAAYNSITARVKRSAIEKFRIIFGFLSAVGTGAAILMKINRLAGGNELLIISVSIFCFGFLPCLFYTMYTKSIGLATERD